ncbi:YkgJ family cysteine cluster protein [Phenylobacterium sp.]|uniref:YkgJ family cysteine cluster protein n=1 Tax=Phenylobacterium sp. TaxID=1871053 RepID=UPI00286D079E|nr:YkgJ family cysteine cluster protein [Phenylobacterium sp.]
MTRPVVAEGKSCGDCGLCCKLMGVKELAKPQFVWCKQFKRGCGCQIYVDRPTTCGEFVCYWLHAPSLGEEWRPDRAGFLMTLAEGGRRLDVEVEPSTPAAWRREPYLSAIRGWAAQGRASGLTLRVWVGRRGNDVTPEGEVDLGLARPASARGARPR